MSNTEPLSNLDILRALQQSILCQNSPSGHISEQDSPGYRRNWVCNNVVLASFNSLFNSPTRSISDLKNREASVRTKAAYAG